VRGRHATRNTAEHALCSVSSLFLLIGWGVWWWVLVGETTALRAVDDGGCTALHAAALGGHRQVMELLEAAGVAPDLMDGAGRTARSYYLGIARDAMDNDRRHHPALSEDRKADLPAVADADGAVAANREAVATTAAVAAATTTTTTKKTAATPEQAGETTPAIGGEDEEEEEEEEECRGGGAGASLLRLLLLEEAAWLRRQQASGACPTAAQLAAFLRRFCTRLRACSSQGGITPPLRGAPNHPPPPPCAHTLAITFSPRDIHSQPCLHSAPDAFGCHPTAVWNSLCHVYCIRRACSERLAGVGWDVEANAPVHGSRPPAALSVVLAVEALLQAASTVVNDGES
jgi:hypothetical protein